MPHASLIIIIICFDTTTGMASTTRHDTTSWIRIELM